MPLDRAGILGAFHADLVLTDEPVAARELRRTLGRSSSEVALVTRADPARPTAGVLEWEYRLRSLASCDSGPWHQGLAADLRPARGAGVKRSRTALAAWCWALEKAGRAWPSRCPGFP